MLQHGGWNWDKIKPTYTVKQGDPLSHNLFNFVTDTLLKSITGDKRQDQRNEVKRVSVRGRPRTTDFVNYGTPETD